MRSGRVLGMLLLTLALMPRHSAFAQPVAIDSWRIFAGWYNNLDDKSGTSLTTASASKTYYYSNGPGVTSQGSASSGATWSEPYPQYMVDLGYSVALRQLHVTTNSTTWSTGGGSFPSIFASNNVTFTVTEPVMGLLQGTSSHSVGTSGEPFAFTGPAGFDWRQQFNLPANSYSSYKAFNSGDYTIQAYIGGLYAGVPNDGATDFTLYLIVPVPEPAGAAGVILLLLAGLTGRRRPGRIV